MTEIVKILAGSRLYGTHTDASDYDYITVELPSVEDLLLKSKGLNTQKKTDLTDAKRFDLVTFIDQACSGQSWALECLFAPQSNLVQSTPLWNLILANRRMFLSQNVDAFVGFAVSQARKYSTKGDRYGSIVSVIKFLESLPDYRVRLNAVVDLAFLPDLTGFVKIDTVREPHGNETYLLVCGKKFQMTQTVDMVLKTLRDMASEYGVRSKLSSLNGQDWKSLSHAVRVAHEAASLLHKGELSFPLESSVLLYEIKNGDRSIEDVEEILSVALTRINKTFTSLPVTVDRLKVNSFLGSILKSYVVNSDLFEKQWLAPLKGKANA